MVLENLMTMEQPWMLRPTFAADAWISDIFTKENDTNEGDAEVVLGDALRRRCLLRRIGRVSLRAVAPLQTLTPSGSSENELAQLQKLRRGGVAPSGRVAKRKSRASKRAITMFITADPANFRQMVQQVTGVRFGGLNGHLPVATVVKPEPQRTIHRLQPSSVLPTLDAPNFFNDSSAAPSRVAQPHTSSGSFVNICWGGGVVGKIFACKDETLIS